MVRIDMYKIVKRGLVFVEVASVAAILLMLTGIGLGTYFGVIEGEKDTLLKEESKTLLDSFTTLSIRRNNELVFNENGVEIFDIKNLNYDLDKLLNEDYMLLDYYPEEYNVSTIVFNNYDQVCNTYFSFTLFKIDYNDRYAVTEFISGKTNIVYGSYNVVKA